MCGKNKVRLAVPLKRANFDKILYEMMYPMTGIYAYVSLQFLAISPENSRNHIMLFIYIYKSKFVELWRSFLQDIRIPLCLSVLAQATRKQSSSLVKYF
jgi:hypothetical protein